MVGLKKPKRLRIYEMTMGKQKFPMVISFGINLENWVDKRGGFGTVMIRARITVERKTQ